MSDTTLATVKKPRWVRPWLWNTLLAVLLLFLAIVSAMVWYDRPHIGAPSAPVNRTVVQAWTVTSCSEPNPALRYRFDSRLIEQLPGDAAPVYFELKTRFSDEVSAELKQLYDEYHLFPTDRAPPQKLEAFLEHHAQLLMDLRQATRYADCDWQVRYSEKSLFTTKLPQVEIVKDFARLLALQIRWQLSKGDFAGAHAGLRSCFALAAHMNRAPAYVPALTAVLIHKMAFEQIEIWIQTPQAPSLYWALTHLPRPLVNERLAFDFELSAFFAHVPALAAWERNEPLDLQAEIAAGEAVFETFLTLTGEKVTDAQRLVALDAYTRRYPQAKDWMLGQGRSPAEIEQLGTQAVVGLYMLHTFRELRDEFMKWQALPLSERGAIPPDLGVWLQQQSETREDFQIASLILTPLPAAIDTIVLFDRNVALLRTVEALRLYAHEHDGHWPTQLADLSPLPVPHDPATAQPLKYSAAGTKAILFLPGLFVPRPSRELRLTIAK